MLDDVVRFRREADEELVALSLPQAVQNIRILREADFQRIVVFLFNLLRRLRHRAIIGNGGRHDDNVGVIITRVHFLLEIPRILDVNDADAFGNRQVLRTGNERDVRAFHGRRARDGVAHFAAGPVSDIADRIDIFLRAAGADEDFFPRQEIFSVQRFFHRRQNRFPLRIATFPRRMAGEMPRFRLDNHVAPSGQFP